jgi:hypothetical protein
MKQGMVLLLLACLFSTGCMTLPALWGEDKPPTPTAANSDKSTAAEKLAQQAKPVTADQANVTNAHDTARALQRELELDEQVGQ